MIKNLLYSLFLHFLLIFVIYLNFNLQKIDENKTNEVAVSLMVLNGEEKTNNPAPASTKKAEEEKPEKKDTKQIKENKEASSPKTSTKNKVKKTPKKIAKAKSAKAVKKIVKQEKVEEFKPEEKDEIKQEDAKKNQEDKLQNQNEDKEQNELTKKEEDLGAKKQSSEESEEKKKESPKDSEIVDMANSLENLDLSSREKFNIQSQLKYCYRMAINESKFDGNTKVITRVEINREGKITFDLDKTVDKKRYDDPNENDYRNVITNIQRALDLCSPLRNLPLDKYDIWKEVVLEFGE